MRLAPATVNKLWVLSCNRELVQNVLGLDGVLGDAEENDVTSTSDDDEIFEDGEDNE